MENALYKVISFEVIDIDSVKMDIVLLNLGFRLVAEEVICRLWQLDGPEKSNKIITKELNDWLTEKLSEGLKNDELYVNMIKKDKFGGRFLGEIYIGGHNINREILDLGYAKPYGGKSKEGLWTEDDLNKLRAKLNE